MRYFIVPILVLSLGGAACGARSVGGSPDDGGVPSDGPLPDAPIAPHDYYGYATFTHLLEREPYITSEQVVLTAAFYGEVWDPFRQLQGTVEHLETPDGVACDLALVSGMDGPVPVEPPPELDGGGLFAWTGWDGETPLEVFFDGDTYLSDHRSFGTESWPDWLVDGAMALRFESLGSPQVSPFFTEVFLADIPVFLSPPTGLAIPLSPDPDGTHHVSWLPVVADLLEVRLHFNMDWDDSYFRCYLPEGRTQMRLPQAWLDQWSWGYGELMIYAINEEFVSDGDGVVTLRTVRAREQKIDVFINY